MTVAEAPMIDVHIDSCAWNCLLEFGVDLSTEFPTGAFRIWIPREVEMEVAAIPPEKAELRAFIRESVARRGVRVDVWFGFADPASPPETRKVGGWDEARWVSKEEWEFFDGNRNLIGSGMRRKTHLKKNEADLALAARSFTSVVLTADNKLDGPLAVARAKGGNVIDVCGYRQFIGSFRDYVSAAMAKTVDTLVRP